ncbi:actin cytoskeleton-regulatory complex protein pan1 [Drosophila erecta]|uniref:MANSC domain-containing protein n=1 Tax=Drosophila erecta TaxID=7220 RepID=B3N536_DROER|nr:actin cytoskeleton-regulatory complex protein pan1 [Drosophila erecta]EDV58981.1 uncharacterized protein Dere_GG23674 [Drosophila erecta]
MIANLALPFLLMIAEAAATAEQVEYLQSSPAEHRLSKRMDLEVCIGHFDVHKNTIIRTGESQAIGGKYLQGIELDTIEECERLCCETDACDVYIFERKAGGYCYLFECGPPEDFRCKFTRHANYTSAVLNPQPKPVGELVTTPRPQLPHIHSNNVSQQEWELSNLKLKPEARDKPTVSTAAVVAPTSGTGAGAGLGVGQSPVYQAQSVPAAHCGRFQFTCHSGECIAVYNACDGIPQCEDGSDEGPECNTVMSTATKPGTTSSNLEPMVPAKPMVQQYVPVQQPQQVVAQQMQQQQQQLPQHVIVLGPPPPPPPPPPMVNNREDAAAWANRKMIAEGQQQQQPLPQQQLQQQQSSQPKAEIISTDAQSHIFSHKGGLQLQQPANGQGPPPPQVPGQMAGAAQVQVQGQSPPMQLPGYEANQAVYGMSRSGIYLPQQQAQLQAPAGQQQVPPSVVWPQQAPLAPQQQAPVQQPQSLMPQQSGHVYAAAPANQSPPAAQHVMLPVLNAAPASGKNMGPAADGDYDDYDEETYTEAPKKKQHKHKKVKTKTAKDPIELALEQNKLQPDGSLPALPVPASPVHEQYKMIHDNLAIEFRDHDGHSERPGGAVLSLTLGLLVTAALAILIGCRMRTVTRRARRLGGKTPYSQEADFLVNGMYL